MPLHLPAVQDCNSCGGLWSWSTAGRQQRWQQLNAAAAGSTIVAGGLQQQGVMELLLLLEEEEEWKMVTVMIQILRSQVLIDGRAEGQPGLHPTPLFALSVGCT
jgi:hypothetical protein